jgi:hypothetical protein
MRVALLVLAMLVFVPAAHAGTYEALLCADPANTGFTAQVETDRFEVRTACPPPEGQVGAGLYVGVKASSDGPDGREGAAWTVAAPAGTTLQALKVQRRLRKSDSNYEVAVRSADNTVVDGCVVSACAQQVATNTYGESQAYSFRVRCTRSTGCGASAPDANNPRAWLVIEYALATVSDPVAPTTAAPVMPTGWVRSAGAEFSAADNTGVRTISLRDGDRVLETRTQACDFRHLQPCPATATLAVPDLADGVHQLTVTASDAGGEATTSSATTIKLDRVAPTAPTDLKVERTPIGTYLYTWKNPDQTGMAPITAARLSDGTVVKGENLQQLEATTGDLGVHLEDEAGNADAATAVAATTVEGGATPTLPTIKLNPPILRPSIRTSPKLKVTSAKRSGTKLVIKGTIARQVSAKVVATLARGSRKASISAKPRKGRFTLRLTIPSALRRQGTSTLTVKFAGQGDWAPASVSKKLAYR